MNSFSKNLNDLLRITLAAAFSITSASAVLATVASNAGAPAAGLFAAAPAIALADQDDHHRRDRDDRRGFGGYNGWNNNGWNNNGWNNSGWNNSGWNNGARNRDRDDRWNRDRDDRWNRDRDDRWNRDRDDRWNRDRDDRWNRDRDDRWNRDRR